MRLWSINPKYLDSIGLVACWREALLAKKVLEGKTKGYKNHPQLIRFKSSISSLMAINIYLYSIWIEAQNRGYRFDMSKISLSEEDITKIKIKVTSGQIEYEFALLQYKLLKRDRIKYDELKTIKIVEPNPIFVIVPGKIELWEKPISYLLSKSE